tara:strand:+ start:267 stop:596 length:330 start_codon:yes stop_codon:yes gene_type:complete
MVMSKIDYKNLNKRIVFTENDNRHAQFMMKLREVGVTQSKFFRLIITGFIDDDERLFDFINENSGQSKSKINKINKLKSKGKEMMQDLAFDDTEIENIFDLIAEGHPDL